MGDGDLMASLAEDDGEAVAYVLQIERTARLVLELVQAGGVPWRSLGRGGGA